MADLPPALQLAVDASLDHLDEAGAVFGITGRAQLRLATAATDELELTHVRFQQLHGGVPIFGGEGIVHLTRDRQIARVSDAFVPQIADSLSTTPTLSADQAIGLAIPMRSCATCLTAPPASDLWILRHDGRDHLVWRVQLRIIDGSPRPAMPVLFLDAHDGSLVWEYDNLQTGTGPSLYSGTLAFDTAPNNGLFYLEDLTRKLGTFDMRNATSTLYRFEDADDVWDAASQRAGIDAHHGALKTWEYFKNVHNRNGIDGNGGPVSQTSIDGVTRVITSRVHYSSGYSNAFWDGTVMTYGDGDGSTFSPLVSLDVAGHEMMHGVTQHTAGLVYSGESGALNESFSDVFGAMVERYARGDSDAIWKIGDECYTPNTPGDALRHMNEPHLASNKGYTSDDDPDHYSERYAGSSDNGGVHINSGISNKAFYLVAMGGTHHLGGSMTGIGPDKAAAIWFKALTSYMTSSTNFARGARATYDAAVALHGADSAEAEAVKQAWQLVGVIVDDVAPEIAITAPAEGSTVIAPTTITVDATDNVAVTSVQFLIDNVVRSTDTTAPFTYAWNTAGYNGAHTLAAKAFDAAGNATQSATINVTVQNETVPPAVTITSPADGATVSGVATITADATDNAAIGRVDFYVDGLLYTSDTTAPYSAAWQTTAADVANGPHAITAKAVDTVGNSAMSAPITLDVQNDRTPPEVAVTAPADGAIVSNTIALEATAQDNVAVTRVEFYVDGTQVATDSAPPYSYNWTTSSVTNGNHTVTARAYDALNNVATSAPVTIVVDNDSTPPVASITSPSSGAEASGTLDVTIDASDNVAVARVELYADGLLQGADTAAPWQFSWNTASLGNGPHELTVRAYDALYNKGTSAPVTVTVTNAGIATYDPVLKAPRCAAEGAVCDTGGLIDGRGPVGPEPHAPNTLQGTCTDGSAGYYHATDSLDRLRISTADGLPIAAGKTVTIEATVWSTNGSFDVVDLYYTTTPTAPSWTLITTLTPATGAGARVVSAPFTVPSGTQQAIRAQYRNIGSAASPCYSSSGADRDDLVFAVVDVPDTTAPATAITAPAAGTEVADTVNVTATASDNIGVTEVGLYVDGVKVASDTVAPYSFTWDSNTVPDGPHTLATRALDPSGNAGDSAPVAITVFNADLVAPVVAITSPADGSTVSGTRTVTLTATDNEGVTAVELYVDGILLGTDTTSPYSFSWNTATIPNSQRVLQARARDAAGNIGESAPITVTASNSDTTSPTVSITSPSSGTQVSGVVQITAAATDNWGVASVELYVNGTKVQTVTSSPYVFAWDSYSKANGTHSLYARAIDTSGNVRSSSTISLVVNNVDVTPPVATITAPAAGVVVSGSRTVSATVTDNFGVSAVELWVDGALVGTDTSSPYSFSWDTRAVANGPRTLQVRGRDAAGNVGMSAPVEVTVNNPDVTAPTTMITSPAQNATLSGVVEVTTTTSDNIGVASLELLLDGAVIQTITQAPWTFTWDTRTAANRTHTLRTRARDAAGNIGQSTLFNVTVDNGVGTAVYDAALGAPSCAVGFDGCDSAALLVGRAHLGPEPNAPNTIGSPCGDGGSGGFHASDSIDRLRVYTADGSPLAYGKAVTIEATIWNYSNLLESDVLDLYYTGSAASPSWVYIGSIQPNSPQGIRVVTATYTLPYGGLQAIRANLRRKPLLGSSSPSTCSGGAYADHDDLVFAVQ